MRHSHNKEGFTLFELLISLTLLAVILVIVFTSLNLGVRIWEKGEKGNEERRKSRIVQDLLKNQLTAMHAGKVYDGSGEKRIFKGSPDGLAFVSAVSIVPGNDYGMVFVRYRNEEVEKDSYTLSVFEKNLVFMTEADFEDQDEEAFHELLTAFESIGFEYGKREASGEITWRENWSAEEDGEMPCGVKVTLRKGENDTPLTVTAPVYSDPGEEEQK